MSEWQPIASASAYAEQMAEVSATDAIINGLRDEIRMCLATPKGYREAAELRSSLLMWQGMRERMLMCATALRPPITGEG